MKAFILAAGRGIRLWPHTANYPKCLLDIGGLTLLERQLFQLKDAGICEIIVVGGFRINTVNSIIKKTGISDIHLIYNPFYAHSDNLISLWLARSYMDGPQVLLNGDIIFNPQALEELISLESTCTIMSQKKQSYEEDDMKILAENSLVKTIGKGIPCKDANAVSLGILSFKKTAARILREALEEIVQIEQSLTSHFPAVIQYMIDAGHPVFTHCVPAFNCADIDTIDDLKFITKQWHRFYSSNQVQFAGI